MRNWLRTACILLLAGCLLFTAAAGTAESMHREVKNPELDMELTVGYDGMITYGKAVPMRVTIRNFGGDDFFRSIWTSDELMVRSELIEQNGIRALEPLEAAMFLYQNRCL